MKSILILALVAFAGCSARELEPSEPDNLGDARAALHALPILDGKTPEAAKAHLMDALPSGAARRSVLWHLDRGQPKLATDALNRLIDLWLINESTNARHEPFPHSTDPPDVIQLVADIAHYRRTHPSTSPSREVSEALAGILDRGLMAERDLNTETRIRTGIRRPDTPQQLAKPPSDDSQFLSISTKTPPLLWVVNISTMDLPEIVRYSAEIHCGGHVEMMRTVNRGSDDDFYDISENDAETALITLSPTDAASIYGNAVALLNRFHFHPGTVPSSGHHISVRLLVGDTAMEIHEGGFASADEYPKEFQAIRALLDSHSPEYVQVSDLIK
ncbi:MAG: hypothetical protein HN919_01420 [Verrucomicrobia bacterium]|jgi:hypothetical protein|nr:hypothetical protein [Verrucomicrobiota bacterium]MBT7064936.1 hypothetical protein [Verrucomicrobiota bacterium]